MQNFSTNNISSSESCQDSSLSEVWSLFAAIDKVTIVTSHTD